MGWGEQEVKVGNNTGSWGSKSVSPTESWGSQIVVDNKTLKAILSQISTYVDQGRYSEALSYLNTAYIPTNIKNQYSKMLSALQAYLIAMESGNVSEALEILKTNKGALKEIGFDIEKIKAELENFELTLIFESNSPLPDPRNPQELKFIRVIDGGKNSVSIEQLQKFLRGTLDRNGNPYLTISPEYKAGEINQATAVALANYYLDRKLLSSKSQVQTGDDVYKALLRENKTPKLTILWTLGLSNQLANDYNRNTYSISFSNLLRTSKLGRRLLAEWPKRLKAGLVYINWQKNIEDVKVLATIVAYLRGKGKDEKILSQV